jgi:hypothetical protein
MTAQVASPSTGQPAAPAAAQKTVPNVDLLRVRYGAWLIIAAFALLAVVFGVAVSQFSVASDVTAVVASVATVVGTIIGAYFGVQVGSSGKEAAESQRNQAERVTRVALAKLNPADADTVLKML